MTKMFVKKPYLTLVAIVIVLTFGGVSLSKMQTNLMPDMDMPYLAVITTEIGASPQKVLLYIRHLCCDILTLLPGFP